MATFKEKFDEKFMQEVNYMFDELNSFKYTRKNLKLNNKNKNIILEMYKKEIKTLVLAEEDVDVKKRFIIEVTYNLNRLYVEELKKLDFKQQFILIDEEDLFYCDIDVEDEECVDSTYMLNELMRHVRNDTLNDVFVNEKISEQILNHLDLLSEYKEKLYKNTSQSERYKKMVEKKHGIYRGAILKSLDKVSKEIGVNHILREEVIIKYSQEYKKGFRYEITILI